MKTNLFFLLFFLIAISSCTEDEDSVPFDPAKQSEVPDEFKGKWLRGNFSMTQFWSHSGQYLGNAFESSIGFDFKKDGTYEQFLVFQSRDYGCVTQAFSFFKGTVKFDEANRSFTVYPREGKFRGFYSCSPNSNFNRDAKREELKTQTFHYSWSQSGGTKYMEIRFTPEDEFASFFRQVNW